MFAQVYPAFAPITDPALNDDPGRFRNDAFLKKLYGSSKSEIARNISLSVAGVSKILKS